MDLLAKAPEVVDSRAAQDYSRSWILPVQVVNRQTLLVRRTTDHENYDVLRPERKVYGRLKLTVTMNTNRS